MLYIKTIRIALLVARPLGVLAALVWIVLIIIDAGRGTFQPLDLLWLCFCLTGWLMRIPHDPVKDLRGLLKERDSSDQQTAQITSQMRRECDFKRPFALMLGFAPEKQSKEEQGFIVYTPHFLKSPEDVRAFSREANPAPGQYVFGWLWWWDGHGNMEFHKTQLEVVEYLWGVAERPQLSVS